MRRIKRVTLGVAGLFLFLALGGCAGNPLIERIQSATSFISTASAATVSPQAIEIAANTYDAVAVTATAYLELPNCKRAKTAVCRSSKATIPLQKAVLAGRIARNEAIRFLKEHPGELGPSGLYDAINAAVATIHKIYEIHKVEAVVAASGGAR